jgi:hypothetical protein
MEAQAQCGIIRRILHTLFTIPAHTPMPGRMKAGLLALWLMTGFVALVFFLGLLYFVIPHKPDYSYAGVIPLVVLFFGYPLPIFLFVCLWAIRRGHRLAAILCLFVPVFLSLPLVTELVIASLSVSLDAFDLAFSNEIFGLLQWIVRLFMLAVLIAAAPLAFGVRAKEWYWQWQRKKDYVSRKERR